MIKWWREDQRRTSGLWGQQRSIAPVVVVSHKQEHLVRTAMHVVEKQVVGAQLHDELSSQITLRMIKTLELYHNTYSARQLYA